MNRYYLLFKCCGNTISLGFVNNEGSHGEYCLNCNTKNPETEVKIEQ